MAEHDLVRGCDVTSFPRLRRRAGLATWLAIIVRRRPRPPGDAVRVAGAIAQGVRAGRRSSDVVIATFHWSIERATDENARQRAFARTALVAGATAVIGAHPHVLQPVRRPGRRKLIAYSLGNFVWSAGSPSTSRTGILRLLLSGRGVEAAKLLPARIEHTRPRLLGR